MKRFIICGPPCAGKSSFVLENASPGDLVWDYDLIHQALSGQRDHDHLTEIRPYVIAAREAIFNQLEAHESQAAWLITSSPKQNEVDSLAERFGAEIVYLEIDQELAHQRADIDQRPENWHNYIENWFENSDISSKGWSGKMNKKVFKARFEFKEDGDPGDFKAIFAKLNVIDLDVDVTIPGAFHQGQEVIIEPWNHGWELPAGKGVIQSDESFAWVEGKFFLDTEAGLENYKTVKNLGDLAEWSYTFNILDAGHGDFEGTPVQFLKDLDVIGVSPVTRGAGIDTRTMAIKGKKAAIRSHSTPTTEDPWDGPANEARARSGEDVAYYSRIFAWRDPDGDPAVKSTYKFIHHMVSENGDPGAANVRACQTGIGVLNGGRGGTVIPDSDRQGVWNHLASHLRDADLEPPELKSLDEISEESKKGESKGKPRDQLLTEIQILEIEILNMEK